MSKLSLVGAGPGDPELITLKALRVIAKADYILYDSLVNVKIFDQLEDFDTNKLIFVGKRRGQSYKQKEINAQILKLLSQGFHIVRLKGGDPFIFARAMEELELAIEHGYEYEVVPGLTNGLAVPVNAGIALTLREKSDTVVLATGHEINDNKIQLWQDIIKQGSTLVIYMGLGSIDQTIKSLELDEDLPVIAISNGSLDTEKRVVSTAAQIIQDLIDHNIEAPVIFTIGKHIDYCFSKESKQNKKIIKPINMKKPLDLFQNVQELGTSPFFILIISGTDTIKHPGISAAGKDAESLSYTACLDAEFISLGHTVTKPELPFSPSGIVSPAIISKACLNLLDAEILIIDAGAHYPAQCPKLELRDRPSGDIASEQALEMEEVEALYQRAQSILPETKFNPKQDQLIIAECVVAGTTTAQGVLEALGHNVAGLCSSSFPNANHESKKKIIDQALAKDPGYRAKVKANPLYAISLIGDTMQAISAGLCKYASDHNIPVTLAGGTQMLAIKTLIDHLFESKQIQIATSPWIVNDQSSDFKKLCQDLIPNTEINYPSLEDIENNEMLASEVNKICQANNYDLDFKKIISAYNQGNVKEGLGMGALLTILQPSQQPLA